jgi:nicotinamidase/pyrazinamidase
MHGLLVIDVQNDFCPDGTLAVTGGDQIIAGINSAMLKFDAVILTQDWHPAAHSSFASSHNAAPMSTIQMPYGPQVMWPNHCIQGTNGASFHPRLDVDRADMIVRKGHNTAIDSYSAFFENDHTTPTGLDGYLRTRGIDRVTLAGLATDFCVYYSAIDAANLGFDVTVDLGLCRAIDLDGSLDNAIAAMIAADITLLGAR